MTSNAVLVLSIISLTVIFIQGKPPLCPQKYHQPKNAYIHHGNCSILQFWIPKHEDVVKTLSGYLENDNNYNTWLFGFTSPLAREYLMGKGMLGNREGILYDQLVFDNAAMSMEFMAGAMPTAVQDYCMQKKAFNFTFM